MIKPLRQKFVFVNMVMVLMVMVVAFYCNYAFNKVNMYDKSIEVLDRTIRDGTPENMKTFLVMVNSEGRPYQFRGFNGSKDEELDAAEKLVAPALESDSYVGDISGEDMRFMRHRTHSGATIAFTSIKDEKTAIRGIVSFSFYIYICCSFVFLLFSFYLAKLATDPVAKAFNQRKQLVADASHELKTPLTAIMASADVLLSSDTVSAEDKAWAKSIKSSATDMNELLANMLTLAKSDGAKAQRAETKVDLSALATEVGLNYEAVFFEEGKHFDTDIDAGIFVKGNENELKQLMKIFLDNAKKYSAEKGSAKLSLKALKDRAVLAVFNTGEPIPEDELDKIFDRFYRVDKVRGAASGYGLGLSIAKTIAAAHSTKICVKSDADGTSFSVPFKYAK